MAYIQCMLDPHADSQTSDSQRDTDQMTVKFGMTSSQRNMYVLASIASVCRDVLLLQQKVKQMLTCQMTVWTELLLSCKSLEHSFLLAAHCLQQFCCLVVLHDAIIVRSKLDMLSILNSADCSLGLAHVLLTMTGAWSTVAANSERQNFEWQHS